jgi:hypothetical protein
VAAIEAALSRLAAFVSPGHKRSVMRVVGVRYKVSSMRPPVLFLSFNTDARRGLVA